jgi:hypothetical protein
MLISEQLDKLEQEPFGADGESVASIRARLSPEQLASPGQLGIHISWRAGMPGVIRLSLRIVGHDEILCELTHRLAAHMSWQDIEEMVAEWKQLGYVYDPLQMEWA